MRKPVVKIDTEGRRVQVYPSIQDAADENFMSHTAVRFRCLRRTQKEMDFGFTFRFLGDEDIGEVAKRKPGNRKVCRICGGQPDGRHAKYCSDCRKRVIAEGAAAGNNGYRLMMGWYK